MRPLTIAEVGQLFGLTLPRAPGKAKCPFRKHLKRKDKTFRVYRSRRAGDELQFCWSCDRGPNNPGDAIAFYARMAGVDRKTAFRRLKAEGFDMPGTGGGPAPDEEDRDRQAYERAQRGSAHAIPTRGVQPARVLPFNQAQWEKWREYRAGALADFAKLRGLSEEFLRAQGMVEIPGGFVGFTYTDPLTGKPCRVKVRSVERGAWWVEPRSSKDDPDAKALGPLYLGHALTKVGSKEPVILVEGEIDALSLVYVGILNVVSLPDGAESAKTVDLRPIAGRYAPWMLATDDDPAGDQSARVLEARAGVTAAPRVKWRRLVMDGGTEDLQAFKDANDALRGGFGQADFLSCLDIASAGRFAGRLPWRLAG